MAFRKRPNRSASVGPLPRGQDRLDSFDLETEPTLFAFLRISSSSTTRWVGFGRRFDTTGAGSTTTGFSMITGGTGSEACAGSPFSSRRSVLVPHRLRFVGPFRAAQRQVQRPVILHQRQLVGIARLDHHRDAAGLLQTVLVLLVEDSSKIPRNRHKWSLPPLETSFPTQTLLDFLEERAARFSY